MSTTTSITLIWTKFVEYMQSYLVELINKRKHADEEDEKRDLLSNLVNANEEFSGDGEQRLGEEELIGTCKRFIKQPASFKLLPLREYVHVLHCWT